MVVGGLGNAGLKRSDGACGAAVREEAEKGGNLVAVHSRWLTGWMLCASIRNLMKHRHRAPSAVCCVCSTVGRSVGETFHRDGTDPAGSDRTNERTAHGTAKFHHLQGLFAAA